MRSEFSVTEVSVSWEIISAQIHRCICTTFLFYRKIRAHFAPSVAAGWGSARKRRRLAASPAQPRATPPTPRNLQIRKNPAEAGFREPPVRLELTTFRLQGGCSSQLS